MEEYNETKENEGKTLTELREEKLDELARNLFTLDDNTGHLYFDCAKFQEFTKALVVQLLEEDGLGVDDADVKHQYAISAMDWAKNYYEKIDCIFSCKEDLAVYVEKLRFQYEPTKREIQEKRKANWSAQLLRKLVFRNTLQWLKSNKFRYKWLCELFDTTEISESTFKTLRKEYIYYG